MENHLQAIIMQIRPVNCENCRPAVIQLTAPQCAGVRGRRAVFGSGTNAGTIWEYAVFLYGCSTLI